MNETLIEKLLDQVDLEWTAFHYYNQLNIICNNSAFYLKNMAIYFKKEAIEEQNHANSLLNCLNIEYGKIFIERIRSPQVTKFCNKKYTMISKKNILELFIEIREIEKQIHVNLKNLYEAINASINMCLYKLLEDMIEKQIESINSINIYITQIELIPENMTHMIDNIFANDI